MWHRGEVGEMQAPRMDFSVLQLPKPCRAPGSAVQTISACPLHTAWLLDTVAATHT